MGGTRSRAGATAAEDAAEIPDGGGFDDLPPADGDAVAAEPDDVGAAEPDDVGAAEPGDAGAEEGEMLEPAAPTIEVPEGHVLVVVAQRRSLRVPVVVGQRFEGGQLVDVLGQRTAHAGEMVAVRQDELADLRALGYVEHGGQRAAPEIVSDGRLIGPTINGRPGGMMRFEPGG